VPEFALQTIPGVEIARVGTWNTSTGTWVCTPADIQDAVRAAADPTFRTPVIKLGHTDPRFDGEPAFGVIKNIRASDDGQALLGDLTGVPAWLAEMMPTSYPSRSIEATMDVVTPQGARYGMVVNGLALLGVTLPAIQSLAQLRERLGVTEDVMAAALPEGVTAGASVFASVPAGEGAGVLGDGEGPQRLLLRARGVHRPRHPRRRPGPAVVSDVGRERRQPHVRRPAGSDGGVRARGEHSGSRCSPHRPHAANLRAGTGSRSGLCNRADH
jgi:hypothetical protein